MRSIAWPDSASASSVQSSIGSETNAGPFGASEAVWIARARACGTSCARGGSKLHLTKGWTTRVASRLVRFACIVMWARTCWPAVTSSGEWFAWALKIAPIPLPTPGRRVEVDVGRPAGGLRVAVGHPDRHGLLQPEDVAEVVGELGEHRQLRRAGVAEDRRHPVLAEELERSFPDCAHGRTL